MLKRYTAYIWISSFLLLSCGTNENPENSSLDNTIATVHVLDTIWSQPIANDFLGLSHDWGQAQLMIGNPVYGTNPIYRQLLQNIQDASGGKLIMRIGGSSADKLLNIDTTQLSSFKQLHKDLNSSHGGLQYIMGVNLADQQSNYGTRQLDLLLQYFDTASLAGIEIGSQPDAYPLIFQYRDTNYSIEKYIQEVQQLINGLKPVNKNKLKLLGPSYGGFPGQQWNKLITLSDFGSIEHTNIYLNQLNQYVTTITQNSYCGTSVYCGGNPPKDYLLLAKNTFENPERTLPYVNLAHHQNKKYRIGEMNSLMCSGQEGISNTFQSALWFIDICMEYAYRNVDGVNLHANNWNELNGWELASPFTFNVPEVQKDMAQTTEAPKDISYTKAYELREVFPIYYGMLFFADVMRNAPKVQPLAVESDINLKAWYLEEEDGSKKIVIINKSDQFGSVKIKLPNVTHINYKKLTGNDYSVVSGIKYAHQYISNNGNGSLSGDKKVEQQTNKNADCFSVNMEDYEAILIEFK